jgi:hypothetical protein
VRDDTESAALAHFLMKRCVRHDYSILENRKAAILAESGALFKG